MAIASRVPVRPAYVGFVLPAQIALPVIAGVEVERIVATGDALPSEQRVLNAIVLHAGARQTLLYDILRGAAVVHRGGG